MAQGIFTTKQQLQSLKQNAWAGSQTTPAVEYLVVAGGGGGGAGSTGGGVGGGGGAGGLLQGLTLVTSGTPYTITVGGGGAAGALSYYAGVNGCNSVFGNITALGGGGGGGYGQPYGCSKGAKSGGSGGGAGQSAGSGAPGTLGQGNRGGDYNYSHQNGGNGGGGAGTPGINNYGNYGGSGGSGISTVITGTLTGYAGGGGGASQCSPAICRNNGGFGGGGWGRAGCPHATSGSVNTGGGGGAGGFSNGASAAGGSGIVIISYPDIYNAPSALTGTYTASTSGSGSISLNGSNQYLSTATSSDYSFGTGDFTVESWYYLSSLPSNGYLIDLGTPNGVRFQIFSNQIYFALASGSNVVASAGVGLSLNTWYHIAGVRSSGTLTLYINGVSAGSVSNTLNITDTNCTIGCNGSIIDFFPGYITNLRILKGTALYTANFTPPTAPLAPITNTKLLLSLVSGAYLVDSSGTSKTVTPTNSPSWNQSSPFATGLGYKNRVYTWTGSGTVTF